MIKLDREYLVNICKMGQSAECCRYIIVNPDVGITCAKLTSLKQTLDDKVDTMRAKADNCEGR